LPFLAKTVGRFIGFGWRYLFRIGRGLALKLNPISTKKKIGFSDKIWENFLRQCFTKKIIKKVEFCEWKRFALLFGFRRNFFLQINIEFFHHLGFPIAFRLFKEFLTRSGGREFVPCFWESI